MAKMRLKFGKHQTLDVGRDGKRIMKHPGDIVELDDKQMLAFKDKFEDPGVADGLVNKAKAAREAAAEAEAAAEEARLNAEAIGESAKAEAKSSASASSSSSAKK